VVIVACLVRETSIIAALALGVAFVRARRFRAAAAFALAPVLVLAAWRLWVLYRVGPVEPLGPVFAAPMTWIPVVLQVRDARELVGVAALGLCFGGAALMRWSAPEVSYIGFVILAAVLGPKVYEAPSLVWSRVLVTLPLLAAVLAERKTGLQRWVLRGVPLAFAAGGGALWMPRVALVLLIAAAMLSLARAISARSPTAERPRT
jgi:hypothetical protein